MLQKVAKVFLELPPITSRRVIVTSRMRKLEYLEWCMHAHFLQIILLRSCKYLQVFAGFAVFVLFYFAYTDLFTTLQQYSIPS